MKKSTFTLIAIIVIVLVSALTSCAGRNGWGCHGTGKYMTRVQ